MKIGVRLQNYAAMVVCLDSFSNHAFSFTIIIRNFYFGRVKIHDMKSLAMIILNHYAEQVLKSPWETKMALTKKKTRKSKKSTIFKPSVLNVINLNLNLAYDYNRHGFFR